MAHISTRTHGIIDYITGASLIALPLLLARRAERPEVTIPVVMGAGSLVYSAFTDYEMGVERVLSMRAHLYIDIANGMLMAASPWIFGFNRRTWMPHLMVGLSEIAIALNTAMYTEQEERQLANG
jgi:hypothetical protein